MTFRVDGVSASYSQLRRSCNCGAVLGFITTATLGCVAEAELIAADAEIAALQVRLPSMGAWVEVHWGLPDGVVVRILHRSRSSP